MPARRRNRRCRLPSLCRGRSVAGLRFELRRGRVFWLWGRVPLTPALALARRAVAGTCLGTRARIGIAPCVHLSRSFPMALLLALTLALVPELMVALARGRALMLASTLTLALALPRTFPRPCHRRVGAGVGNGAGTGLGARLGARAGAGVGTGLDARAGIGVAALRSPVAALSAAVSFRRYSALMLAPALVSGVGVGVVARAALVPGLVLALVLVRVWCPRCCCYGRCRSGSRCRIRFRWL